jgi:dolichyl-diphosphooligosaccharide--protein glycosyltransferase
MSKDSLTVVNALLAVAFLQCLYYIAKEAYQIRLYAIESYGRVIHEFDPWFNARSTSVRIAKSSDALEDVVGSDGDGRCAWCWMEGLLFVVCARGRSLERSPLTLSSQYLYEHGWKAFSTWFDYMVWYPLGRPVGTTIYPGLQVTAVWIKNHILSDWSINDICVFMPAWFGAAATLAVTWLTYECTRHRASQGSILSEFPLIREVYKYIVVPLVRLGFDLLEKAVPSSSAWGLRPPTQNDQYNTFAPMACALSAAFIMSVIPAHLLRSIGGGYDNESVAMTAMVLTFCCWTFSLREDWNNLWITTALGLLTGVAYFYMVAAWGGYVFVVNMVAAHAGWLVLTGRYSQRLHRAYTAFYVFGTALATTVPVVGWTPLRSLEQMAPLIGFASLQLIEFVEVQKRKHRWGVVQTWKARVTVFMAAGVVAAGLAYLLLGQGYFGPISSRVRGLFVKHTKTGNPLVDSVAEHQAASVRHLRIIYF